MGSSVLPDASFANLSASSFPLLRAWAFIHLHRILHSLISISFSFCLISSVSYVCLFALFSESSFVLLSLCTVTSLSSSFAWLVCMYSSGFKIENASAWLFVHLVSILYIKLIVGCLVLLGLCLLLHPVLSCFRQCRCLMSLLLPVCCLSLSL